MNPKRKYELLNMCPETCVSYFRAVHLLNKSFTAVCSDVASLVSINIFITNLITLFLTVTDYIYLVIKCSYVTCNYTVIKKTVNLLSHSFEHSYYKALSKLIFV